LVDVDLELQSELLRIENEIRWLADYYDHLKNRKNCVDFKNKLYSEWQDYEVVNNVACGSDYKLQISF
jgi:hypothetical protein